MFFDDVQTNRPAFGREMHLYYKVTGRVCGAARGSCGQRGRSRADGTAGQNQSGLLPGSGDWHLRTRAWACELSQQVVLTRSSPRHGTTARSRGSPAGHQGAVTRGGCRRTSVSATAGQAQDQRGQAERLGIKPGQVVQEIGYDDDCDEDLRDAIGDVDGVELVGEEYDDVVDVVLLWWRDGDGDLVDAVVDALTPLADGGYIWLRTR